MDKHNRRMKTIGQLLAVLLIVACSGISIAEPVQDPSNRIVIVVDGSGSYKSRQGEAVDRAISLLNEMAQIKLQRWESETDIITIISLDAMPDVLWQGNLRELKSLDSKEWTKRFLARSDYSGCTDVGAAFNLATPYLEGDPAFVSKYLFVFSDLVDEPPTKSVRQCRTASNAPTVNFPWNSLKDVSVAVFWAPPDQKLLWRQAAEQHGMAATFALYTTSESANVTIKPPPRPVVKVTEADRQKDRDRYKEAATAVLKWGGWFLLGIASLSLVGGILERLRRRQLRRAPVPTPGTMRPLPLAGRRPGTPPAGEPRPIRPLPHEANNRR